MFTYGMKHTNTHHPLNPKSCNRFTETATPIQISGGISKITIATGQRDETGCAEEASPNTTPKRMKGKTMNNQ